MRICSHDLPEMNVEKEHANGILPASDKPAAVPTRSCSAMPTEMNRSGYCCLNQIARDESSRSPERATTFGLEAPSSSNPSPNPSRVGLSSGMSQSLRLVRSAHSLRTGRERSRTDQLRERLRQLFFVGGDPMPGGLAFHERHAFAFDGARDDHRRLACDGF